MKKKTLLKKFGIEYSDIKVLGGDKYCYDYFTTSHEERDFAQGVPNGSLFIDISDCDQRESIIGERILNSWLKMDNFIHLMFTGHTVSLFFCPLPENPKTMSILDWAKDFNHKNCEVYKNFKIICAPDGSWRVKPPRGYVK